LRRKVVELLEDFLVSVLHGLLFIDVTRTKSHKGVKKLETILKLEAEKRFFPQLMNR
jgi:hypothetical protein